MRLIFVIFILISSYSYSQAPPGYYDSAAGLTGQQLRAALNNIIDDHEIQSYNSIWVHFQDTDDKDDGSVWDMYSDIPGGNPLYSYTFMADQCGSYSSEGDCYNREHSFPQSWFNDASPMNTDLFHIYPSDGYVNGKRSNYPFGEVLDASWSSSNGCEVGYCSFTGYSGTVFEPIDEYKGDFARTYFYMMTRYMDLVSGWNSDMLSGNDMASWARELLLEWDAADTVSQKETDRNNAVFQIQNNRNPFIDMPEFTGLIWGYPAGLKEIGNSNIRLWYTKGYVYFESKILSTGSIDIFDISGRLLTSFKTISKTQGCQVNLSSGIYLAIFESDGKRQNFKLLISK